MGKITGKRKLTDEELRRWGGNLANGETWDGTDSRQVFEMMLDTAGNAYDAGEVDWDFDEADAERMLALCQEAEK